MTPVGRKALLLGSGELGKEVAIELQRLGVEVVACDKYPNAPAMQAAHRSYIFNMLDGVELRRVVELEKPDHIIPEIEAIATPTLLELEKEGYNVTPTARAAWLTMNRDKTPAFGRSMDNIILNHKNYRTFTKIKVPTLIIHGHFDPLVMRSNLKHVAEVNSKYVRFVSVMGHHDVSAQKRSKMLIELKKVLREEKAK